MEDEPKSILFVCHGNICRSPIAEFVMKDLLAKNGISGVRVESAAASSEEIGNPVYPPARSVLAAHGISCAGKTARRITRSDFGDFDLILAMDNSNLRNISRICGAELASKARLLMEFAGKPNCEVDDPWYSGDFEAAYSDIYAACSGLLELFV